MINFEEIEGLSNIFNEGGIMSELLIKPVDATEELFVALESQGIITRICPGHDVIGLKEGEADYKEVYHTAAQFGPHKLIAVTTNNSQPLKFVYHSEREDFLLIDQLEAEALILTISKLKSNELEMKIRNRTIASEDFIAIICKKNDPYLSFFTMNPYFAHTETCLKESHKNNGKPPSFYVSEPLDIDEKAIDFGDYQLRIDV